MPLESVLERKDGFGYIHKIIIIKFKSHHLVLRLLRNVWSTRVWVGDWFCKGKTHHPQCTLQELNYIVV